MGQVLTMGEENLNILILDDDEELGELLKDFLQKTTACHVTCVTHESDFWDQVSAQNFDTLFLDYKLPGTTGLDILAQMKNTGVDIPTVMMTGEGSEHIAAKAIQSGALDYLVKGQYSFSILPPLIQKAVRHRETQLAMQRYLNQIRYQATLLDNMRDAVVVWGLDNRITYWNAAAEQLFGVTADDRLNRSVTEVFFFHFDPQIEIPTLREGEKTQVEHRFHKPGGDWVWINLVITGLFDKSKTSEPIGMMIVARDITDRKKAEEQLHAAQAHLAQSARLASIGELAAGVAHQISNPLTTIIAEAQILAQQLGRDNSGRESVDAIVQAGWRAQEVINELMKFSQPAQIDFSPTSVNETIQAALLLAGAHIEAAGVTLVTDLQPDLLEVVANSRQLTDLWVNLLLLARSSFEFRGNHTIKIQTRNSDERSIMVLVTDDGSPIRPEDYDTIFEPQLIPTGSGRGTGMELSLCREIVRQNKGNIFITGNDKETTFHVSFQGKGA